MDRPQAFRLDGTMPQEYDPVAGTRMPGVVWSGNVHAAQGPGFVLYECSACAAIVRDQARHDAWHDAQAN